MGSGLQIRSSSETVRSFWRLPVFSVLRGSKSSTCVSASATGRCSTPRGTMMNSPGSTIASWFSAQAKRSRWNSILDHCLRCQKDGLSSNDVSIR